MKLGTTVYLHLSDVLRLRADDDADDMYPVPAGIKEYLNHWFKFCIDWQTVIFAEHFGSNRVILWQTVVKW